jgi:hypothetical protein
MAGQGQVYSFDTSALIDGIERYYPIDNFPALWQKIDELIDEGRLRVSEEAWKESIGADAPLKEWCLEVGAHREKCVYKTDATVAIIAGTIAAHYPTWVKQGGKNSADPFVIAVGEVNSGIVISGETNGGPSKPKIPYVCSQRSVHHGRVVDVVVKENWRFG